MKNSNFGAKIVRISNSNLETKTLTIEAKTQDFLKTSNISLHLIFTHQIEI